MAVVALVPAESGEQLLRDDHRRVAPHPLCDDRARGGWTYASTGWNYGWTQAVGSPLRLPFVSYRGSRIECMVGWKTSGAFDLQCRRANSPNATETPG